MISFLKGEVKFKTDNTACVLANGVGWDINMSHSENIEVGDSIEVYVHTHYRESEISLWGFYSEKELEIFKLLISVSGVGPRTGQVILREKGIEQISYAIHTNDADMLKVSGVGVKTAQKIILELKGKIPYIYSSDTYNTSNEMPQNNKLKGIFEDLYTALTALGYTHLDVNNFINKAKIEYKDTSYTTEDLIKIFLKSL
jgi:holliday junction DNA helicase RuvA